MAPNAHIKKAFLAMKALGIEEAQVKPVLKRLLALYDKNWELIAEDNYRALADAIFDDQDAQVIFSYHFCCLIDSLVFISLVISSMAFIPFWYSLQVSFPCL